MADQPYETALIVDTEEVLCTLLRGFLVDNDGPFQDAIVTSDVEAAAEHVRRLGDSLSLIVCRCARPDRSSTSVFEGFAKRFDPDYPVLRMSGDANLLTNVAGAFGVERQELATMDHARQAAHTAIERFNAR